MAPGLNSPTVVPPADFAEAAADCLARHIRRANDLRGSVSLGLSGGSTPEPVYVLLGQRSDVPWSSVSIYQVDERAVPPDHAQSNFAMIRRTLLEQVPGLAERTFRMRGEWVPVSEEAHRYSTMLPTRLDVVALGVGTDGHTASLFPHSAAVAELAHRVIEARAPDPPRVRLSLTRPVLARAHSLVSLVSGRAKAQAVRMALIEPGTVEECPARIARAGAWVLDTEAAALL